MLDLFYSGRARRALVLGAGIATAIGTGPTAAADPVGTSGIHTGLAADGNDHSYCINYGGDSRGPTWTREMLARLDEQTAMNRGRDFGTDCSDFNVDVIFKTMTSSNLNLRGRSQCLHTWTSGEDAGRCNRALVEIHWTALANMPTGFSFEQNARKTICHEHGHAVGLTQYNDAAEAFPTPPDGQHDCMISGAVTNEARWITLSQHHLNHVNEVFK